MSAHQPIGRFVRLGWRRQRLLILACATVALCRLGLWVLPFRRASKLAARLSAGRDICPADDVAGLLVEVSSAVRLASRAVPDSTCLVRALAARVLLGRRGVRSEIRYGVGRGPDGRFRAHAWLECGGRVIVGGDEDLTQYSVLPHVA